MLDENNIIDNKPCEDFTCYFRKSCANHNKKLFDSMSWSDYVKNRKACNECGFFECTYCNKNHCICNS